MKLYTNAFAPSPRRVRMFAAEKGIALTLVELDISKGETQAPAYLQVNPVGETPVLELDDGTRIGESLAICRYLEALQPEPNLMGSTPIERGMTKDTARQAGLLAESKRLRDAIEAQSSDRSRATAKAR